MNELIREIEEDIRRERFDKLWHSFGRVMVGVSLAVILATIVIEFVQSRKQSQAMESTAIFIKGLDRINIEDYKGAIQVFSDLSNDESSPYYGLSMLRKAQAEAALSDSDSANKTYGALAAHDPVFGKLAAMMTLSGDNKKPVTAQNALQSIEPNTPFYFTNGEWRGWQLLQQGKKDEAVAQFLTLYNDPTVPPSMHGRLAEVLNHVGADKMPSEQLENKDAAHE